MFYKHAENECKIRKLGVSQNSAETVPLILMPLINTVRWGYFASISTVQALVGKSPGIS